DRSTEYRVLKTLTPVSSPAKPGEGRKTSPPRRLFLARDHHLGAVRQVAPRPEDDLVLGRQPRQDTDLQAVVLAVAHRHPGGTAVADHVHEPLTALGPVDDAARRH